MDLPQNPVCFLYYCLLYLAYWRMKSFDWHYRTNSTVLIFRLNLFLGPRSQARSDYVFLLEQWIISCSLQVSYITFRQEKSDEHTCTAACTQDAHMFEHKPGYAIRASLHLYTYVIICHVAVPFIMPAAVSGDRLKRNQLHHIRSVAAVGYSFDFFLMYSLTGFFFATTQIPPANVLLIFFFFRENCCFLTTSITGINVCIYHRCMLAVWGVQKKWYLLVTVCKKKRVKKTKERQNKERNYLFSSSHLVIIAINIVSCTTCIFAHFLLTMQHQL